MNITSDTEWTEVQLDRALAPELEVEDPDFGTELPRGFTVRVATNPMGIPVRRLFQLEGTAPPPNIKLYEAYEVYLIPHTISVMKDASDRKVTSIGMKVEYLNGRKTCSIISLLPEAEFFEIGSLRFRCALSLSGEATATTESQGKILQVPSLSLEASAGVSGSLLLQGTMVTSRVAAVGKGSRECEWLFQLDREPLSGQDIQTWSVVVLPKGQKVLEYELVPYFTHRAVYWMRSHRWEPREPERVRCTLLDP